MTKILVIGDVHGEWRYMERILFDALHFHNVDYAVQVGDLGYGWPGNREYKLGRHRWDDHQIDRIQNLKKLWIDGNHENHDQIELDGGNTMSGWEYWPRGEVRRFGDCGLFLGIGGASSIDKDSRLVHEKRTGRKVWWDQENIHSSDVDKALYAIDMLEEGEKIRGVFSHEFPNGFGYPYLEKIFTCGDNDKAHLRRVLDYAKPELWFFGHYHKVANGTFTHPGGEDKRTMWACAPDVRYNTYWIIDKEGVTKHRLSLS